MATTSWIDEARQRHARLTTVVISIIENLLRNSDIEYLSVSGRTKTTRSIQEKIKRKGYKEPEKQLTDISGIRVILYLESDVNKVCELIENSFSVDLENSSNNHDLASTDRVGYRSKHFVCDLGKDRTSVPEYRNFQGLKFEFQIRTVLQHAWAELSHDREYKFAGILPPEIQRKLFLYAGLLEIADRGFDEIASDIDAYIVSIQDDANNGILTAEINSVSLHEFFQKWAEKNSIKIHDVISSQNISPLVRELEAFGIKTIGDLNRIIPDSYAKTYIELNENSNIFGIIRDWMIIKDHRKLSSIKVDWVLSPGEDEIFRSLMSNGKYEDLKKTNLYFED